MPEWQLCLQNGRFDHPNRLFHNISETWKNCLQSDSDVKELIPEFYDTSSDSNSFESQLGSFLQNRLELDLGTRQDNVRVNDVILPRWARNDAALFIKKMREALESSYVSERLHKWIDLIFGCKQRGEEAVRADNLFFYLCYEGAVDLESIRKYSERKSLEIQIQEFGQIPTQLFKQAHLQRAKHDLGNNPKLDMDAIVRREEAQSSGGRVDRMPANASKENESVECEAYSEFKINAGNFSNLTVKLEVKLHKDQVNDCIFIETKPKASVRSSEFQLPSVCSVSNDNWLKIYSLEEKSLFRSHNVSDFSLSSVGCIQLSNGQSVSDSENFDENSREDRADQRWVIWSFVLKN